MDSMNFVEKQTFQNNCGDNNNQNNDTGCACNKRYFMYQLYVTFGSDETMHRFL